MFSWSIIEVVRIYCPQSLHPVAFPIKLVLRLWRTNFIVTASSAIKYFYNLDAKGRPDANLSKMLDLLFINHLSFSIYIYSFMQWWSRFSCVLLATSITWKIYIKFCDLQEMLSLEWIIKLKFFCVTLDLKTLMIISFGQVRQLLFSHYQKPGVVWFPLADAYVRIRLPTSNNFHQPQHYLVETQLSKRDSFGHP